MNDATIQRRTFLAGLAVIGAPLRLFAPLLGPFQESEFKIQLGQEWGDFHITTFTDGGITARFNNSAMERLDGSSGWSAFYKSSLQEFAAIMVKRPAPRTIAVSGCQISRPQSGGDLWLYLPQLEEHIKRCVSGGTFSPVLTATSDEH